jgi:hypothetical protein
VIYLFYGSDVEKVRSQAFAWVAAARKKEPNLSYVRLSREEITPAIIEEITESGGLFVSKLLVLLDEPFPPTRKAEDEDESEGESASIIEDSIDALASSGNAILIVAPKLHAAKAKKLEAKAAKVYRFDKPKEFERGFNSALVNALEARSRDKLWAEIVRAQKLGDAPEALHGLLHWKARDLLEKGGRSWKKSEARALSLQLITLLQESRRTGADLSRSLEKFALTV